MSEYKRLTGQKWTDDIDLKKEYGYSYIYKQLYELEDKIENGTLREVPCNVGDKVYQFDNGGEIYESEIKGLIYDCGNFAFDERAIGKSVFLTKAEAEARLKKLQEKQK